MRARTSAVIDALIKKLRTVAIADGYLHDVSQVTGGQRDFDEQELAGGVCVCVAFAGTQLAEKAANAPQQVSVLELVVDAHKHKGEGADVQLEGLDLLADVERALLGDLSYLKPLGFVRAQRAQIETEDIEISSDGNAIVASMAVSIPYVKQYSTPYEE